MIFYVIMWLLEIIIIIIIIFLNQYLYFSRRWNEINEWMNNINSQLQNRFVNMERQCWTNTLYFRREFIEIVGIPTSAPDNELEVTFCKNVDKVGVNDRDIES